jgi:hypothetical protein
MSSMNDQALEYSVGSFTSGCSGGHKDRWVYQHRKIQIHMSSMQPIEEFSIIEDAVVKALLTETGGQSRGNLPLKGAALLDMET